MREPWDSCWTTSPTVVPNHFPSDLPSLRSLRFGSLLVYRPGALKPEDSDITANARRATLWLKHSDPRVTERIALRVRERVNEGMFEPFFGPEVTLVPVPGHAPSQSDKQQSSTIALVQALQSRRLGVARSLLRRVTKVNKAAWSPPGERPTLADHYRTIQVAELPQLPIGSPHRFTIVDDVVTSGATLLACAARLLETFPGATILAFAAVRSLSGVDQVDRIVDPLEDGRITRVDEGSTRRRP